MHSYCVINISHHSPVDYKLGRSRGPAPCAVTISILTGPSPCAERLDAGVGMGQDQSHGAAHLLSRPPSALTRHRHGRHTELILQIEEGYQVPVEREEAHAGRSRSRYRRGTSRLTRSASAIKTRFRGERSRRGGQNQHRRTTSPFEGSISAKTYSDGRRQRRSTKRRHGRRRKGSQPGASGPRPRH